MIGSGLPWVDAIAASFVPYSFGEFHRAELPRLAAERAALVAHDLGVRRGLGDAVHQMRVSCRRLRSDLRTFRVLLEDPRIDSVRRGTRQRGALRLSLPRLEL